MKPLKRAFWAFTFALVMLFAVSSPSVGLTAEQPEKAPIAVGARGDEVRAVQKFLADGGFYAGAIDGIFGPITAKAVKEFQRNNDLEVTGIVDKETFAYLGRLTSEPSRYSRSIVMKASAYTAHDPGNGSYTYRGNYLRKGLVAVDPSVIPLGTRLYIKGYGYAVADDIGSAIKGNRIDLAYENRREALAFGVRQVTVYILD
ncbi:peptidoglycan-binding protein [Sporomusa paucivorans]|uniref:peptidoglycan-binding protein n=1 Tax=Sporomusa TaxID=2375 RepID=UPI003570AAC3